MSIDSVPKKGTRGTRPEYYYEIDLYEKPIPKGLGGSALEIESKNPAV